MPVNEARSYGKKSCLYESLFLISDDGCNVKTKDRIGV